MEEVEKPYSKLEWLFYIIILPSIFSLALFVILATFFGFNVLDKAIEVGHKVPGLSSVLPELKQDREDPENEHNQVAQSLRETEQKLQHVESEYTALEQELLKKEDEVSQLQARYEQLLQELEEKRITEVDYRNKVRDLAKLYGGMSASKAALILENLTLMESASILEQMNNNQRAAILAKLEPPFAADVTVVMKEMNKVDHPEMAVLQERVSVLMEEMNKQIGGASTTITLNQMANTFSQMPTKQAATILEDMSKASGEFQLGLGILANMNDVNRSAIMSEMTTELAKKYTKELVK